MMMLMLMMLMGLPLVTPPSSLIPHPSSLIPSIPPLLAGEELKGGLLLVRCQRIMLRAVSGAIYRAGLYWQTFTGTINRAATSHYFINRTLGVFTPALALIFLTPQLIRAADVSTSIPETGVSWWQLVKVILALALVLGLVIVTIFALKRLQAKSPAKGGGIEPLGGLALGPRRSLQLIKAGNRVFLIGVTDHHLSRIAEFSDINEVASFSTENKTTPLPVFGDILRRITGKRPGNP
ncbi:MAG: flagellar biosynthetic protein FliO [Calditrichota bacterium]